MDEKALEVSSGHQLDGEIAESNDLDQQIDPKKEKILLAKLDIFFTPVIMLVYLSCFLDRTNIVCLPKIHYYIQTLTLHQGNVKVAGMPEDIGASEQQFSTAVSIFYGKRPSHEIDSMLIQFSHICCIRDSVCHSPQKADSSGSPIESLRRLVSDHRLLRIHSECWWSLCQPSCARCMRGRSLPFPHALPHDGLPERGASETCGIPLQLHSSSRRIRRAPCLCASANGRCSRLCWLAVSYAICRAYTSLTLPKLGLHH